VKFFLRVKSFSCEKILRVEINFAACALKKMPPFDGEVDVRLPKVEMDFDNPLHKNFMAMGIRKAFSNDAEFFNVVNGTQLKIDNAIHRAKISIDEEGTEAAAVTEIVMVGATATAQRPKIVYFHADKPFIFVIRDFESNVTLFTGTVNRF